MRLIIPVLLLPFYCLSQTCVVLKTTKDAIYVGADSRSTRLNIRTNSIDSIPVINCKIHVVGKYNFVTIGRFSDIASLLADSVCRNNSGGFQKVMLAYNRLFIERCSFLLNTYQNNYPNYFKILLSDTIMSQIIFFGFEEDSITIGHLKYWLNQKPDRTISMNSQLVPSSGGIVAGEINSVKGLINMKETWSKGIVAGIDKIIKLAAKAEPKTIAEPIDIIKVTRTGTVWIRRKPMCVD